MQLVVAVSTHYHLAPISHLESTWLRLSARLQRMWACPSTSDYGMFVAVAMLQQHRDTLLGLRTFEQLMQVGGGGGMTNNKV